MSDTTISVTVRPINLRDYRCIYPGEFQHRPAGIVIDFDRAEVCADFSTGDGVPEAEFNHRAVFCGFDSRLKLSIVREFARRAGDILKTILENDEYRLHGCYGYLSTFRANAEVEAFMLDVLTAGQDCENWDRRLSA